MAGKTAYAGYPSVVMYKGPAKKGPVQHLVWGDWLRVKATRPDGWCEVHSRGADGWVRKDQIQNERLLEVVFVDIGQGDGALMVTPADKHFVIDAGEGDNMFRFLRWRYAGFKRKWTFEAAFISHPDEDHYGGFRPLFEHKNVRFRAVYHNGIIERKGRGLEQLGPTKRISGHRYLTDLMRTAGGLRKFLAQAARWKGKRYAGMLHEALASGRVDDIRMLHGATFGSPERVFLDGYGSDRDLSIEVLGPVPEEDDDGKLLLRGFSRVGPTKNGHSIVLKVRYRDVTLLLGGDLNIPSEEYLIEHYTGRPARPKTPEEQRQLIDAARKTFQVDVAKACHHGSPDVHISYLQSVNPIATVISSGDDEPHAHPSADALGAYGRSGRGDRPLIFSTELARSAKEMIKHPREIRRQIDELESTIAAATTAKARASARKKRDELLNKVLGRSIAVFGAINLRTDGRRVVMAQKLERPRNAGHKWDIYRLERKAEGPLQFIPKH